MTVATLVKVVPANVGSTTIVSVALELAGIVPRLPVRIPPFCAVVPCEDVAETNDTPAGRTFVTITPVALEGPLFAIVSV